MPSKKENSKTSPSFEKFLDISRQDLATILVDGFLQEGRDKKAIAKKQLDTNRDKKAQIVHLLEEHQKILEKAYYLFKEKDPTGAARKVVDKIKNVQVVEVLFKFDLLTEQDFSILNLTAMRVYESGDLDTANTLFAYIAVLFPFQIQPYIFLTTIAWRREGVEKAVAIYEQLIKALKNPLLFLYAGDCFKFAGKKKEAKKIFEEAIQLCSEDQKVEVSPELAALKAELLEELKEL